MEFFDFSTTYLTYQTYYTYRTYHIYYPIPKLGVAIFASSLES